MRNKLNPWLKVMDKRSHLSPFVILLLITISLSIRCKDYFTAPGPQPDYIEAKIEYEPKFSVFGVLRPDSTDMGLPQSFIKLESTFPIDNWDSDSLTDATVLLYRIKDGVAVDSFQFEFTDMGSFPDTLFRHRGVFPQGGESYQLVCKKSGYPTLLAETTVPAKPVIAPGSVVVSSGKVRFQVLRDVRAGLYEVVLLGEGYYLSGRFLRPESGNVDISINLDESAGLPLVLLLYAYDLNLADYLSANISIKPNIYQSDFSTVENGYGCFGSLNLISMEISGQGGK